jgi:trans-aconitate 2-methyltransferase
MWSPDQYLRFAAERRQPFDDLLSLVERRAQMRVVDLGCGTGELTRELHESLAAEETIGVDSSDAMLAKAAQFATDTLRFEKADIATFTSEHPYDLIFSNAAFHWVPDHEQLFARMRNLLTEDGQLAVQMPANDSHTSHVVAAELAREFGIAPRQDYVLPVEQYAELLDRLGAKRQHVRLQVYGHVLPASGDVVEWVRGALLTHYQSLLSPERFDDFLAEYRKRMHDALGDQQPFFYTYKRVLMHAAF